MTSDSFCRHLDDHARNASRKGIPGRDESPRGVAGRQSWMLGVRANSVTGCLFPMTFIILTTVAPVAAEQPSDAKIPPSGSVRFIPTDREVSVPKRFRQKEHTFAFETEFERRSGSVEVYRVLFPSPVVTDVDVNNTVHGHYFQPDGDGPFPGVVVLHILGGEFALSQMVANSLAREGVAALFIKMPYYGERRADDNPRRMIDRNPHLTVDGMTQAVLDIRRAAAWLGARPDVDQNRLGVTGISLGGIMSALSAEAEPRFRRIAVYLGGGNLGPMVWDNPDPRIDEHRQRWKNSGGTRDSFIETISVVDPVTYGHLLRNRKMLMVAAEHDEIIPKAATLALWDAVDRRPELVWLDCGHITAVRYIFGEVPRMCRFFNDD